MGRTNPILWNVFSKVFHNDKALFEDFLNVDVLNDIDDTMIVGAKEIYKKKTQKISEILKVLRTIEILMIQVRCQQKVEDYAKIFVATTYVYARSVFDHLDDTKAKEFRVPICSVKSLPGHVDVLQLDKEFMKPVIQKLKDGMQVEIDKTRKVLNKQLKYHQQERINFDE